MDKDVLVHDELACAIRAALTADLVKAEFRDNPRPMAGHCYVASEAYFHLAGGKQAGWKAVGLEHEGAQHWWLENQARQVRDLTGEQFLTPVPYEQGRGRGFLTREPSRRAQIVIARVRAAGRGTLSA